MKKSRTHIPHYVIVKAPGLLPMLYKISELSMELKVPDRTLRDWLKIGAPYIRDNGEGIWINGQEFARWVAGQRKPKQERKLTCSQGYCMHCNKIVELVDPKIIPLKGKLVNIRGICPDCAGIVNRGDRLPNTSIEKTVTTVL
ncbi:MAG: hypothetical protein ABSA23_15495 [Anaerolineales bacterium]|jgi:hypothetical protein